MMKRWITLLVLGLLAASVGCTEDESELWQQGFDIDGPYTGTTGLAYVDRKNQEVVLLSPQGDDLTLDVRRAKLGDDPGASYVSHDEATLYTLNEESETLSLTSFEDGAP